MHLPQKSSPDKKIANICCDGLLLSNSANFICLTFKVVSQKMILTRPVYTIFTPLSYTTGIKQDTSITLKCQHVTKLSVYDDFTVGGNATRKQTKTPPSSSLVTYNNRELNQSLFHLLTSLPSFKMLSHLKPLRKPA